MKSFAVIVFAIFVAVTSSASVERGLKQDFEDFKALIPVDKIKEIAVDAFINDKEVQASVAYLQSDEFATVATQVFSRPEVKNFVNYLQAAGLDVIRVLDKLADLLGLPHFKPNMMAASEAKTAGLNGLIDDVIAVLPRAQLRKLFDEKLETSPEFAELFRKLQSLEFQDILNFVHNSKEVTDMIQKLREHNVDVDKVVDLVKGFFGWF